MDDDRQPKAKKQKLLGFDYRTWKPLPDYGPWIKTIDELFETHGAVMHMSFVDRYENLKKTPFDKVFDFTDDDTISHFINHPKLLGSVQGCQNFTRICASKKSYWIFNTVDIRWGIDLTDKRLGKFIAASLDTGNPLIAERIVEDPQFNVRMIEKKVDIINEIFDIWLRQPVDEKLKVRLLKLFFKKKILKPELMAKRESFWEMVTKHRLHNILDAILAVPGLKVTKKLETMGHVPVNTIIKTNDLEIIQKVFAHPSMKANRYLIQMCDPFTGALDGLEPSTIDFIRDQVKPGGELDHRRASLTFAMTVLMCDDYLDLVSMEDEF